MTKKKWSTEFNLRSLHLPHRIDYKVIQLFKASTEKIIQAWKNNWFFFISSLLSVRLAAVCEVDINRHVGWPRVVIHSMLLRARVLRHWREYQYGCQSDCPCCRWANPSLTVKPTSRLFKSARVDGINYKSNEFTCSSAWNEMSSLDDKACKKINIYTDRGWGNSWNCFSSWTMVDGFVYYWMKAFEILDSWNNWKLKLIH